MGQISQVYQPWQLLERDQACRQAVQKESSISHGSVPFSLSFLQDIPYRYSPSML